MGGFLFLKTRETKASGSLLVQGQPGLQSELLDSQGCYTERAHLEERKERRERKREEEGEGEGGREGGRKRDPEVKFVFASCTAEI